MPGAIVIDDKGEVSPLGPGRLHALVAGPASERDAAAYAVCNLGYVLLHWRGRRVRAQMRTALVRPATLIGLYYVLHDLAPEQILLARLGAEGGAHEIFDDVAEFAATIERDIESAHRHHSTYALSMRSLRQLERPRYARFAPAAALWTACRGALPIDLLVILRRFGLCGRATLLRKPAGSGRLLYEHVGTGYSFVGNACYTLTLIDKDVELLPDPDYGDRVAASYHASVSAGEPRLETVSAVILRSDGARIWSYYDRLILPWRTADGTSCVLGLSEIRRRALAA